MADGDLYKPTGATTTVSGTQWQLSSNDGGTWTNTATPPNTTNDVFLNGISLTVDANLSFKTLRNTTTYNKNQTAVSMQSVSNLTTGGKLILTGSYTLTGSATAHGDLALDGNNCISGGAANALIDNTGQVGAQTTTLNNVRVKAGTAATHHGFNVVQTAAMTFNCSNNCRFQGAVSTAACHGFNSALTNANITFSGDVEFKGGDVASSYGLNVPNNATIKINNTSTTQVKMTGGTQSGCFGVSLTALGSTIIIGDIATGDLNYLITAGSGATSYGLNITGLTTTANINIGVPSTSANTTNVVVSSSTSPAIYCYVTVAPIVIYRGTLKTTSNGWQPIVTLSKLFILGSNAVLVEFPTATGSASFTTNATVTNVNEASIWGYLTTNAEFSTTNAVAKLIKDNLNATVSSRAVAGDAMTLTTGERTTVASSVWSSATRSLTTFGTLISDIWAYLTASATTTGSIGKRISDNLDTNVSSRLASGSYTAPDNATISTINTNVSAIKTKTDNLPANTTTEFSTINTKLDTIDDYIDTEIAAIKTATDRIPTNPASVQSTGDQIATLQ